MKFHPSLRVPKFCIHVCCSNRPVHIHVQACHHCGEPTLRHIHHAFDTIPLQNFMLLRHTTLYCTICTTNSSHSTVNYWLVWDCHSGSHCKICHHHKTVNSLTTNSTHTFTINGAWTCPDINSFAFIAPLIIPQLVPSAGWLSWNQQMHNLGAYLLPVPSSQSFIGPS